MDMLILGGNSQIGIELQKYCLDKGLSYRATFKESIPNSDKFFYYDPLVDSDIDLDHYTLVVNCIAYTDVDGCQRNPELSFRLNQWLPMELASKCKYFGNKFVHFSTDYVFDGQKGPYVEDDKPNPINVYGTHKLLSEVTMMDKNPDSLILRLSGLYSKSTGKSFIERAVEKLKAGEDMWGVVDQYYTPVFASDVARAITLLMGQNGIWHVCGTELLNRYQILQKIHSKFDSKSLITPIKTADIKSDARRPMYGGLISPKINALLPNYEFLTIDEVLENEYR